jgi:hypothetical protein
MEPIEVRVQRLVEGDLAVVYKFWFHEMRQLSAREEPAEAPLYL